MHRHNRMTDGDLFDGTARGYSGGPPCVAHSVTSTLAAERKKPSIDTDEALVLRFVLERGPRGATDDEIQVALNISGDTERPRRITLTQKNKLKALEIEGYEIVRTTRKGGKAVVWVIA